MEFRSAEKCPEERSFIIVVNYWLGHKLHDLELCYIPIVFIHAIDNHSLVLHTHILSYKF